MRRIFKRNKTYYIRLTISKDLKVHFGYRKEYIKSLETCNINNANIIASYLIAKFNFIKKSINMLSNLEIESLVKEFESVKFKDIINRNNYLKVEEIDKQIEQLQTNKYKKLIQNEMNDIINFLAAKDEDIEAFGISEELGNKLESYIIQTKINALSEVRKSIKLENLSNTNIVNNINFVTIENAIKEFFDSRFEKGEEKSLKRYINIFLDFCKIENIEYVQNIEYKTITAYKIYLKALKPNVKIGSLDQNLKNISIFLNYCTSKAHYIQNVTTDLAFEKTIEELNRVKRDPFSKEDIEKIFNNLDLLILTPGGKLVKNNKEYELIIKIAQYAGARQNEIIQLTKEDIKQEKDSEIWYFDINANNGKKIKNIESIRKIPIHSKIEKEVLEHVKGLKQNKLFNLSSNKFSSSFSTFKQKLNFKETQVFHSFRNTLQNDLKQSFVELTIVDCIVGHKTSESKMTLDYTQPYYLTTLKNAIEKISY